MGCWLVYFVAAGLSYHSLLLSDFMQRCLSTPQIDRDTASNATGDGNASTLHASVMSLLKEWVRAKLNCNSWKDVLASAVNVRIPLALMPVADPLLVYSSQSPEWQFTGTCVNASKQSTA